MDDPAPVAGSVRGGSSFRSATEDAEVAAASTDFSVKRRIASVDCEMELRSRGHGCQLEQYMRFRQPYASYGSLMARRVDFSTLSSWMDRFNEPLRDLTADHRAFIPAVMIAGMCIFGIIIGGSVTKFASDNPATIPILCTVVPGIVLGYGVMFYAIFKISDPPKFIRAFSTISDIASEITATEAAPLNMEIVLIEGYSRLPERDRRSFNPDKAMRTVRLQFLIYEQMQRRLAPVSSSNESDKSSLYTESSTEDKPSTRPRVAPRVSDDDSVHTESSLDDKPPTARQTSPAPLAVSARHSSLLPMQERWLAAQSSQQLIDALRTLTTHIAHISDRTQLNSIRQHIIATAPAHRARLGDGWKVVAPQFGAFLSACNARDAALQTRTSAR